MPLVEQELLTLPEHISSPPICIGVRSIRSLVLYVCFVDRCLSYCTFSFGHFVVCFFFDIRILIIPLVSSNFSSDGSIYVCSFVFDPRFGRYEKSIKKENFNIIYELFNNYILTTHVNLK